MTPFDPEDLVPARERPSDPADPAVDPLDLDADAAAARAARREAGGATEFGTDTGLGSGVQRSRYTARSESDDRAGAAAGDGDTATPSARRTGPGGWLAFGLLVALGTAGLTGIALSFHYVPSANLAHASLRALETDLEHGALLRSLHWMSSSVAAGLAMMVLLGAFVRADWRHRGAAAWWSGVGVFLVTLAFGVSGELLPWSEQAVFATEVRTGLIAAAPGLGPALRDAALGGEVVASPALTRFHALHVALLPPLLIGLLWWHVRARARHAPAARRRVGFAHAAVGLAVAAGIGYAAFRWHPPLGEVFVTGDAGFEAFPEWNWLWLNKLIKLTPADLEFVPAVVVPGVLLVGMLALPWLHRERASRFVKPVLLVPGLAIVAAMAVLSWLNAAERPENRPTLPYVLDWNDDEREGYALVRRGDCIECHQVDWDGVVYRGDEDNDKASDYTLDELADFGDPDEFAAYLAAPEDLDMPPYDHLTLEQRRKIALFVKALERAVHGK